MKELNYVVDFYSPRQGGDTAIRISVFVGVEVDGDYVYEANYDYEEQLDDEAISWAEAVMAAQLPSLDIRDWECECEVYG
jgi:hypothetical protein